MEDFGNINEPEKYQKLRAKSEEIGFTMASDMYIGSLLKTLISSKPKSNILELGTGTGLSLSWMIEGMDSESKITSIDNDVRLTEIVRPYFCDDTRVDIICADGAEWIKDYSGNSFDLTFADAWPGKFTQMEETLNLLKIGGLYVIDDLSFQSDWPIKHQEKVDHLISHLENHNGLCVTKLNWSTGIIIASKIC